ncbi:hypothetical protein [Halorubrum sp. Ea1]|uniref:hypothetical protein n=1 Tax=Halorubrum sp. Ea1 TaxID=1480718 RepID=UPI001140084E|nr:hypothetical protein [Halorubrum sp. Ea1]
MSAISKRSDDEMDSLEWAARHREELEREANSDLPHAWVAESILQRLDEEDVDLSDDDPEDEEGDS